MLRDGQRLVTDLYKSVVMNFKDKIENDISFVSMEATVQLEFVNEKWRTVVRKLFVIALSDVRLNKSQD